MSYLPTDPQSPQILWQHAQIPPQVVAPGFGDYEHVGDWGWEYFGPNAYAWEAPADSAPQPAPILPDPAWGSSGLGCGCGGTCGGCGDHDHGLGQGLLNTGLFQSTDISTWSWMEWAVLGLGVWGAANILGDVSSGARSVRRSFKR
jgi:hypothetical protein